MKSSTLLAYFLDFIHLLIVILIIFGPYFVTKKLIPFMFILYWVILTTYYDNKCHITKFTNKLLDIKQCVNFTDRYFMTDKEIEEINCCESPTYPTILWFLTTFSALYTLNRFSKEYKIDFAPNNITKMIFIMIIISWVIFTYLVSYDYEGS